MAKYQILKIMEIVKIIHQTNRLTEISTYMRMWKMMRNSLELTLNKILNIKIITTRINRTMIKPTKMINLINKLSIKIVKKMMKNRIYNMTMAIIKTSTITIISTMITLMIKSMIVTQINTTMLMITKSIWINRLMMTIK